MSLVRSVTEKIMYYLPCFILGLIICSQLLKKKVIIISVRSLQFTGVINLNKYFSVECKYFFTKILWYAKLNKSA